MTSGGRRELLGRSGKDNSRGSAAVRPYPLKGNHEGEQQTYCVYVGTMTSVYIYDTHSHWLYDMYMKDVDTLYTRC